MDDEEWYPSESFGESTVLLGGPPLQFYTSFPLRSVAPIQ
jgi:hypothetical protein